MSAPSDLSDFMEDPVEYFDWSATRLWSMPTRDQQIYQLAGLRHRFHQLRDRIPYLKKLADRDKIDSVDDFDDIVPLLFEHTVYKSYPASLLANNKFGLITNWLGKLTTSDLSKVDVSACDSMDSWFDILDAETDLCIHHSSGTTGTVSLFPKAKKEFQSQAKQFPLRFQSFGDPRPTDPRPKAHVISPSFRSGGSAHFRAIDMIRHHVAHDDDNFMHVAFPQRMSADILYLAGRIAGAKARGELDRLEIAPAMLERLAAFEAGQAERADQMREFLESVSAALAGKRVWLSAAPSYLLPLAEKGLAAGKQHLFDPTSAISTGGGAKNVVLAPDWKDRLLKFTGGTRVSVNYSMTEMTAFNMSCSRGNYHLAPWLVPFVLDPDTSKPLARTGTVTGRMAFFDLVPDTHWGGFISGDEVTLTWDTPCGCGQTGSFVAPTIDRYSAQRGGDDKISCAASAEAQEEAMDFLTQIQNDAVSG